MHPMYSELLLSVRVGGRKRMSRQKYLSNIGQDVHMFRKLICDVFRTNYEMVI